MTQLDILIEIFKMNGGQMRYIDLYNAYEDYVGYKLTAGQKGGIRKNIQTHCKQCKSFCGEELFEPVEKLGNGYWRLIWK